MTTETTLSIVEQLPEWPLETVRKPRKKKSAKEKKPRAPSQSTSMVELALDIYDLRMGTDNTPFVVPKVGPAFVRSLRYSADSLRSELSATYYKQKGACPSSSACADALRVLEGKASECGPAETVHLRVARDDNQIWVDLGDPDGTAVHIDETGWTPIDLRALGTPRFRRSEITRPLPAPRPGKLEDLRQFLNVTDAAWELLCGYLVAAHFPGVPLPIGLLTGEQGTGKSSAARFIAQLIDPTSVPLRKAPRDPDDWVVSATPSWLVTVDNLSSISEWLSDAFCRASTGEGLVKRKLYSDHGVSAVFLRRCILLTSIDAGILRGDFAERLITFELARISRSERKLEGELDAQFERLHASILGGLYDRVVKTLRALATVTTPDGLPRMADFGRILAAMDAACGTEALARYEEQQKDSCAAVVDGDVIAQAILIFMSKHRSWSGSSTELLTELVRPDSCPPKFWPSSPQRLAGLLKRTSPALESRGVRVEEDRTGKNRIKRLTRLENFDAHPIVEEDPF